MHEEDGKEGALQGSNELRQSSVQSNDQVAAVDVNSTPQLNDENGADLLKDSNTFHLAVSDIHELEIRKLRKRKYIMHVIFCGAAAILVFWYAYYYTKACKERKYYEESDEHY